jgi:hypothetical protein
VNLRVWLAFLTVVAGASDGWAWGATGHEWIRGIAVEKLPDNVPAFVRTPEAADEIAVLGRELDRSKGAGHEHDSERDPGHYVDLGDNSDVMGVLPVNQLPDTREEYDMTSSGRNSKRCAEVSDIASHGEIDAFPLGARRRVRAGAGRQSQPRPRTSRPSARIAVPTSA